MNLTLIWLLIIPILGAFAVWYFNRDEGLDSLKISGISLVVGVALVLGAFYASYGSAVNDTEIWSGQVTEKNRVHGHYSQPYDCFCSTDSKGNRSCQTCYEDHYTVNWACDTTIGSFTIKSLDSTSRSVYNTDDPARYREIKKGDPVSKTNTYTNYVQAVPNSLFAVIDKNKANTFNVPPYPDSIYDIYKIDRFLSPGFSFTDAKQWNDDISNRLRELGPSKQVNVIIVVTKQIDPTYVYALRDRWEGANKNDVVVIIGSENGSKINFVDVVSWTKSEIFKIELKDRIQSIGIIERTQVINAVFDQISKNFERRRMREFEYLKGEIDPPTWLIVSLVVALIIGYSIVAGYSRIEEFRYHQKRR